MTATDFLHRIVRTPTMIAPVAVLGSFSGFAHRDDAAAGILTISTHDMAVQPSHTCRL